MMTRGTRKATAAVVAVAASVCLSTPAFALEEICTEPMSEIQLGAALGDAEEAFAAGDLDDYRDGLRLIYGRIICLEVPIERPLLARMARHQSVSAFLDQSEDVARRWLSMSKAADPELPWDEAFHDQHPIRVLASETTVEAPVLTADRVVKVPKKGGVFVDGLLTLEPAARPGTKHLIQVFDEDKGFVHGYWQEGETWPAFMLEEGKKMSAPKWYDGEFQPPAEGDPITPPPLLEVEEPTRGVKPKRSPLVPLAVSGGLLVGSGLTYGLAGVSRSGLYEQETVDDVVGVRNRTNTLVYISGGLLAGAVGFGVLGGLSVSNQGVTFRGKF